MKKANVNEYQEILIDQIEIDAENPRIANSLSYYDLAKVDGNTIALLLGTKTSACESLRESIKENRGIIHPIIVNKEPDGIDRVVEGNTRLQIYKDFRRDKVPGNWGNV